MKRYIRPVSLSNKKLFSNNKDSSWGWYTAACIISMILIALLSPIKENASFNQIAFETPSVPDFEIDALVQKITTDPANPRLAKGDGIDPVVVVNVLPATKSDIYPASDFDWDVRAIAAHHLSKTRR